MAHVHTPQVEAMSTPNAATLSPGAVVILDCGAHHLRAGYASESGPRIDIPSLVGHPRHRGVAVAAGMCELEVGEQAVAKRGLLRAHRTMCNGEVCSWSDMEKLWSHVFFTELQATPDSHCFVTTQPADAPASQKEKTLELMMETFHAHSLFVGTSQVLSLYAYGRTTGLVLDSGADRTLAVPVHEGYALGRHITQSRVAGDALTDYLTALLQQEGYSLGTAAERTVVESAKEKLCYVRLRARSSNNSCLRNGGGGGGGGNGSKRTTQKRTAPLSTEASSLRGEVAARDANGNVAIANSAVTGMYTHGHSGCGRSECSDDDNDEADLVLPDGQTIPLTWHRHRTTEVLFDFSLLDTGASTGRYEPACKVHTEMGEVFVPSFRKGVSWLPFAAINSCEVTLQPQLYANMVLAGNGLAFAHARARLEREVEQLYREKHTSEAVTPIHVRDMACRGYSAWLGGCVLARMPLFSHLVVSRQEYEENGVHIVHCKCL